mmetsp:Transcript_60702/g.172549  ORF Transcript_60702/g.172549 Transcript_60702/m.172549 type:complete len:260 (-) Transcript_60702:45-824(-)
MGCWRRQESRRHPKQLALCHRRNAGQRHGNFCLRVFKIHELPFVEAGPCGHVKVTVAAEVEKDRLSRVFWLPRLADCSSDRVVRLRCRQDALRPREQGAGLECLDLGHSLGLESSQLLEVRDKRGHGMIAEPTRVRRGRHESVPESMGLDKRRHLRGVPEVVGVTPLGERGAAGGLHGEHAEVLGCLFPELLPKEGEAQARKVRTSTSAADQDVRVLPGQLHLLNGFQANDRLVHEDMVQDGTQRVLVLRHICRALNGL